MKKKVDYLAVITMICLVISSVCGVLSMKFDDAYDFVNQYGHTVKMFGYGIYARDSYFKAPIFIGTDYCIIFVFVPLFVYTYLKYKNEKDDNAQLKLISMYGVSLYYAASMAFGATYNQIFLVYIVMLSCSLFGMFQHITKYRVSKEVELTKGLVSFLSISGIALLVAWLPDILIAMIKHGPIANIGVYTTEITYVIDMGIISPICFLSIFLLKKKERAGVIMLAIMLKLCMIVGIMMITQSVCQVLSGIDIPFVALATKSLSFTVLSIFAAYYNRKMYERASS